MKTSSKEIAIIDAACALFKGIHQLEDFVVFAYLFSL